MGGTLLQPSPFFTIKRPNMKYVYKLGVNSIAFTDAKSGVCITKNSPHTANKPLHTFSHAFARAMRGGAIVLDVVDEKPTLDQLDVKTATAEQMGEFTVNDLIAKFDFLDEEDTEELNKLKKKQDKIEFLIDVRENYELD